MNRKIGTLRLTFTYAGCMLGAGFVSGQELWQYFGAFGKWSVPSLILSLTLLGSMTVVSVLLGRHTGETTMDALIVRRNRPWLRNLMGAVTSFLLFGITGIMIAGIGALGQQTLGIPVWIGNAVIAALVCLCAYFGFGGMLAIFTTSVPVLIGVTIMITGASLLRTDLSQVRFTGGETNPMLSGWMFAAVNYTALNFYGTMSVLPPLDKKYRPGRTLPRSVFLGSLALLFVALGILFALAATPDSVSTELPMYDLARRLGVWVGGIYAVLLFLGMFGVAVSNTVAVMHYLEEKFERIRKHSTAIMIVMVAASYAGSLLGFSSLIGYIYPIYGYLGIILMLIIFLNWLMEKNRARLPDETAPEKTDGQ